MKNKSAKQKTKIGKDPKLNKYYSKHLNQYHECTAEEHAMAKDLNKENPFFDWELIVS